MIPYKAVTEHLFEFWEVWGSRKCEDKHRQMAKGVTGGAKFMETGGVNWIEWENCEEPEIHVEKL